MSSHRSPKDIITLLELTINSCFEVAKKNKKLTEKEKAIIDKLIEWKIKLEPQILHTLEAPLNERDFHDIVQQMLNHIIDSVLEQAKSDGVITQEEQNFLDIIISKLKIED